MSEKAIVDKIRDHLRKQGFWVLKIHGGPTQTAGIPDLLAVRDGRAFFFEVKTATGKTSRLQVHTIEQLRSFGAVAEIVCSVADVETVLSGQQF